MSWPATPPNSLSTQLDALAAWRSVLAARVSSLAEALQDNDLLDDTTSWIAATAASAVG